MSFSTDIKEELSKISNLANKAYVKAEMYGYLSTNNIIEEKGCIKFSTESQYNINRFGKLLNNLKIEKYNINIIGKNFSVTISKQESNLLKDIFNNYEIQEDDEHKAFIRGAFLGGGSINNPKNKYHLEIILKNLETAEKIINI